MNKVRLGRTDLMVTPICFGASGLGDMPDTYGYGVDEARAKATVRAIFDSPVNFLDTARIYGFGRSEERIGAVIRERGGPPRTLFFQPSSTATRTPTVLTPRKPDDRSNKVWRRSESTRSICFICTIPSMPFSCRDHRAERRDQGTVPDQGGGSGPGGWSCGGTDRGHDAHSARFRL